MCDALSKVGMGGWVSLSGESDIFICNIKNKIKLIHNLSYTNWHFLNPGKSCLLLNIVTILQLLNCLNPCADHRFHGIKWHGGHFLQCSNLSQTVFFWGGGITNIFIGPSALMYIYRVCKLCFGSFFYVLCISPQPVRKLQGLFCVICFQIWHFGLQEHFRMFLTQLWSPTGSNLNLFCSIQTKWKEYYSDYFLGVCLHHQWTKNEKKIRARSKPLVKCTSPNQS